jgi:hypothetical protein
MDQVLGSISVQKRGERKREREGVGRKDKPNWSKFR